MARTEPTQAGMRAWRAFLEAYAAVTDSLEEELVDGVKLPLAWYDVLVQLSEAPRGRLRMQELARSVLLSKSGLTRLVDRMERAGLVRREPCVDDARGVMAVLTPAGRTRLRGAAPLHLSGIERYFTRYVSDADARSMARALEQIAAASGRQVGQEK